MIDKLLDQVFEKAGDYCADPENRFKISEKLLQPVIQTVAVRFQWLFNCLQALAALLVIQTILIVWILVTVRQMSGH
jgi:hypothetical protein